MINMGSHRGYYDQKIEGIHISRSALPYFKLSKGLANPYSKSKVVNRQEKVSLYPHVNT